MNIVFGICGIGFGHSIRQAATIELLMKYHNIAIIAFGNSKIYFTNYFPHLALFEAKVPWVCTSKDGLLYNETYEKNKKEDYFSHNMKMFEEITKYFSNKIDLIISDYEPTSAQLSYTCNVKLITFDQQSKYLGYNLPPIGNFNRIEEKSRLGYFFPRAFKRVSMSFHHITSSSDPDYPVKIIPVRVRNEILENFCRYRYNK